MSDYHLLRIAVQREWLTEADLDAILREQARGRRDGKDEAAEQVLRRLNRPDAARLLASLRREVGEHAAPAGETLGEPGARPALAAGLPATVGPQTLAPLPDSSAGPPPLPTPATGAQSPSDTDLGGPATSASDSAIAPGGPCFGRYRVIEELGRGGMGVVYRAWDPDLRRQVAIKTLYREDAGSTEMVQRLLREARMAAGLQHPGIVPVYETGLDGGAPYFVMGFVRGTTLHALLAQSPGLERRRGVELVQSAADIVGWAHARKVIHRDLKPANLMVDEHGQMLVMDFGLARQMGESTRWTVSGQLLGTPMYMAPEQAAGEWDRIGPASDVWSLGAILYEVLTGRRPFEGATTGQIFARQAQEDPVPPRQHAPGLAPDLQTICLKALERDPSRRYPDARALADDLGRTLRGEAILARPIGRARRAWRWLSRHQAASVSILAAAITVLVAGSALLREAAATFAESEARAETQRIRREAVAQVQKTSTLTLRVLLAYRRKGGSVRALEADVLNPLREAVQQVASVAADLPEPHYALGRACRAMMLFEEALAEQERALALAPGFLPARYERAVLNSVRLGQEFAGLRRAWIRGHAWGSLRTPTTAGIASVPDEPPSEDELLRANPGVARLRDVLIEDLTRLDAAAEAAAGGEAARLCARGLWLCYRRQSPDDLREAVRLLREALAAEPSLEEAHGGLADALTLLGDSDAAEDALTAGLGVDAGYVPHWLQRANLRMHRGTLALREGEDPSAFYAAAEDDLRQALDLDGEATQLWIVRGQVRQNWAGWREARGEDPSGLFDLALECYTKALAAPTLAAEALTSRAAVHAAIAGFLHRRGLDAGESFRNAEADVRRAIALDPGAAEGPEVLGSLLTDAGSVRAQRGEDPSAHYAAADIALESALRLDPNRASCWLARGFLRIHQGIAQAAGGADPTASYAGAVEDLGRGLAADPRDPTALDHRGLAYANWSGYRERAAGDGAALRARALADYQALIAARPRDLHARMGRAYVHGLEAAAAINAGRDPHEPLQRQIEELEAVVAASPRSAEAWTDLGAARAVRVHWRHMQGADAPAEFGETEAALARAIALAPGSSRAVLDRGVARGRRAVFLLQRGESADAMMRDALADFARARECAPGLVNVPLAVGAFAAAVGVTLRARGQDPTEWYDRAAIALDDVLVAAPDHAEALYRRAQLRSNRANFEAARGLDPLPEYDRAEAEVTRALARRPALPDLWLIRGTIRSNRAFAREARGEDMDADCLAALTDYTEALARHAGLAEAAWRRGWILYVLGRWDEALQDFATASRLDPGSEAGFAAARDDARRRLQLWGGPAPAWLRLLEAGTARLQHAQADAATELLDHGLRAFAAAAAPLPDEKRAALLARPAVRQVVAVAQYNLACLLAVSAGRAEAVPTAAALRDRAFGLLRDACATGVVTAEQMRQDDDLSSLRADPRWRELVEGR